MLHRRRRLDDVLAAAVDERQPVTVETVPGRLASRIVVGTDAELEVSAVGGGQLDDDKDDAARLVSTDDDAARVSSSGLVLAAAATGSGIRGTVAVRIAADAAQSAVHRPLQL